MILTERDGDGWPHAAIDAKPGYWIIYGYTDCAGPAFLSPLRRVPADKRKRFGGFDDAWRVALDEHAPDIDDCAQA